MEEIQSYWQVAGIAHFFYLFSEAFHLPRVSYDELENAFLSGSKNPLLFDGQNGTVFSCLDEVDSVDIESRSVLIKVICSLLRGCTKNNIDYSNWEQRLVELFELSSVDENQPSPFRSRRVDSSGKIVEYKMTFDELPLFEKVKLVYTLCEMRFFREDRLNKVNEIEVDELRVEPLGQDSEGYVYWYFFGTRLYKENPKTAKKIEEKRAKIERLKELQLRSASAKSKMLSKKQMHQSNRNKQLSRPIVNDHSALLNGDSNASTNTEDSRTTNGSNTNVPNGNGNESSDSLNLSSVVDGKSLQIPLPEITQEEMTDGWSVVCQTEPDWTALAESFKKSKSPAEKHLYWLLSENFVPNIHSIYLRKEQEERKRQLQLLPKRNSSRLQIKRLQQEEEDRVQRLLEEEERLQKASNRKYATRHTYI